jgi:hypothetical protein
LTRAKNLKTISGSSGDEMNLKKELHPIGYYVDDRVEMIHQVFLKRGCPGVGSEPKSSRFHLFFSFSPLYR